MDTNEYLSQLKNIDRRIDDKLEEAKSWYMQAQSIGGQGMSENKVQTSKKTDPMADAVVYYLQCCDEASELAHKLAEKKKTILKQLDGLDNEKYYNVLKAYYFKGKSLVEIGYDEGYSRSQIRRIYLSALGAFEKKYGKSYNRRRKVGQKRKEVEQKGTM